MPDFHSAYDGKFTSGRGKRRFDDDDPATAKRVRGRRALPSIEQFDATDGLRDGDRWSTWDQSTPTERGPKPYPDWLVTELAAVDSELGIVKTGKEADVFLVRRGVPGTDRSCLLAAKRYRSSDHRMFHRDSGYLEGRRTRESRVNRAVASRSTADGTAAPRLAETRPGPAELTGLWDQLVQALVALARDGLAHGDLSAYNLLVHDGRLIMIDLPQVVDVIANPRGGFFLTRDAENIARWFGHHGLAGVRPEPADLAALLRREARLD